MTLHKFLYMTPTQNPYALGAGMPPSELAGRDDLREKVRVCIEQLRIGSEIK